MACRSIYAGGRGEIGRRDVLSCGFYDMLYQNQTLTVSLFSVSALFLRSFGWYDERLSFAVLKAVFCSTKHCFLRC